MWKFTVVVVAAILLGAVSPFMAAADDGLVLRTWFQWLPIQVDLLFLPATDGGMMMLAMGVLSLQYLLMFLLVLPMGALLRRIGKIFRRPLQQSLSAH